MFYVPGLTLVPGMWPREPYLQIIGFIDWTDLSVDCEVHTRFGADESPDDGVDGGFDGDGAGVGGGELETVEQDRCSFGINAVAGEGRDEQRDGDLYGLDIFKRRQVELNRDGLRQVLGRCGDRGVRLVGGHSGRRPDEISVTAEEAGVKVAEGGEAKTG
jgi:hypothetical protein